jgi:hypothetical protein
MGKQGSVWYIVVVWDEVVNPGELHDRMELAKETGKTRASLS